MASLRSIFSGSAIIAAITLAALPPAANAADESAWDGDTRAATRLIAGAAQENGSARIFRAGLEMRLSPGWKTYWRYPGDSGIPPQFNFDGSDNVKSVTVLWPAPQRFDDAEGGTIGYKSNVVFPLHVEPKDAARPVMLRLKLDYAICENLCIPAQSQAELSLNGAAGTTDARLRAAEAAVPKTSTLGDTKPLAIKSIHREDSSPTSRVIVDVAAPSQAPVALFAEGPTAEWALPLPKALPGAPEGIKRFAFTLDGIPDGATAKGATLTLTAVSGGAAIETRARLD